jgi:hypothetical protein
MVRLVLAAVATAMVAGCAADRANAHDSPASSSGSRSSFTSAQMICRRAFSSSTVLGWVTANVGELRAYQYGGPVPHLPLQSAFAGIPAGQQAAWCWVRDRPGTASLCGAVPGTPPQRAITVTGPGEDKFRGEMHPVPVVP